MSNINPVFPKGIFSWTDKVDQQSNVLAIDPNSLAAEVISIESTLGTQPQVETDPYTTSTVSYSSVDARLSDLLAGNLHPYASMVFPNVQSIPNGQVTTVGPGGGKWTSNIPGKINTYKPTYDPWGFFNGTDVTCPAGAGGLYLICMGQQWEYSTNGYDAVHVLVQASWQKTAIFYWNFPQTGPTSWDRTGFEARNGATDVIWVGVLTPGDRVQFVSENGTTNPVTTISHGDLQIYGIRKLPSGA